MFTTLKRTARFAALTLALAATGPAFADAAGRQAFERGDFGTAFEQLLPEAEAGDAESQALLANLYRTGRGTDRDYPEAVSWYRRAAAQGNSVAQYNLAVHLREGLGVEKDDAKATHWFREAAVQGLVAAQINLGLRYARGHTVEPDLVLGYAWLQKAAAQGSSEARHKRDLVAKDMTPAQLREGRRRSFSLY